MRKNLLMKKVGMKKVVAFCLSFLLFFYCSPVVLSDFKPYPLDIATESFWFEEYDEEKVGEAFSPEYSSRASLLMEASTGKVIFCDNETQRLPIASVTKIMSILLVVEAVDGGRISLGDVVTVSEYASSMGGSQIFLEPGEKMSVEDLLKSLVVVSANDAAVALAEHVYGSSSGFIEAMNEKAKALGMENTCFKNTTGLDEDGHFSSAYDVALMTRELLKHEMIFKYTSIWMDTIRDGAFGLSNTNRLVRFYDGANGLKTGFTDKAMYCLSGTAKRDGMQLIAVVLGAATSNERFSATKSLLDYGFANFAIVSPEKLYVENIKVDGGEKNTVSADYTPLSVLVKKGDKNNVVQRAYFEEKIISPVKRGTVVGKVVYSINDQEVGESPIVATEDVKKVDFSIMFNKIWSGILKGIF